MIQSVIFASLSVVSIGVPDKAPGVNNRSRLTLRRLSTFNELGEGYCRDKDGQMVWPNTLQVCKDSLSSCADLCRSTESCACIAFAQAPHADTDKQSCAARSLGRCVVYQGADAAIKSSGGEVGPGYTAYAFDPNSRSCKDDPTWTDTLNPKVPNCAKIAALNAMSVEWCKGLREAQRACPVACDACPASASTSTSTRRRTRRRRASGGSPSPPSSSSSGNPPAYKYIWVVPTQLRDDYFEIPGRPQLAEVKFKRQDGKIVTPVSAKNAPGEYSEWNEGPRYAIDGNVRTKWLGFENKGFIVNFGGPVSLSGFTYVTANDYPERDIKQVWLKGSNDQSSWFIIHKSGDLKMQSTRYTELPWESIGTSASTPTPPPPAPAFATPPASTTTARRRRDRRRRDRRRRDRRRRARRRNRRRATTVTPAPTPAPTLAPTPAGISRERAEELLKEAAGSKKTSSVSSDSLASTASGAVANRAQCKIQPSNVRSERHPVCSFFAASLQQNTDFKTVNKVASRFSGDETYGHDKWYPASGVCKLPGDPKSVDRSGYLWLPGPVKAGTRDGGTCRESPSCGGVPTTEYYPDDADESLFHRHGIVGTSFCCGATDLDTWDICESFSFTGPDYGKYHPRHTWQYVDGERKVYEKSGCDALYQYQTRCHSEENPSMPAENCPSYEYHSVMHTPLVESSYALFVCWIFFLVLACLCTGGSAVAAGSASEAEAAEAAGATVLCGALLSFLVFLGCLFAWTGVMVQYWDGCWGEWDPNRVVDAGNLLHGVSENSFRANCWPPLKGTQCSPTCLTYFRQKPGKGLHCGGVVYEFVDNDDPLICMPPCKAKILGEGHIPEMLPFAVTGEEVEITCDEAGGFVRMDGGEGPGMAVCNKEEKGGLDGPWVHDILCRVGSSCGSAILDNEIFDGAGKAFDHLDGLKCTEIEADEPGMPPSYECALPSVSHKCSLPLTCAANHVAEDPDQDTVAYCHDGAWEIRNPCILEVRGLEASLVDVFYYITICVIPFGALCGCCAGGLSSDDGALWRLVGAFVGLLLGGVGVFMLVLAIFFIIVLIFSLPLIIFILIAFGTTIFVANQAKRGRRRGRGRDGESPNSDGDAFEEESQEAQAEMAQAKYEKMKKRIKQVYHFAFKSVPGRAIVRTVYNAPLRAAFLFIRWSLDVFLIASTIDYLFVPETPINFDFPLGIADVNVNLSVLVDTFTELTKFMDFINIKNILQLDFRCDGLVVLFGSFVLLAVEVFVLAFQAADYLGFGKLTEALCETNLRGPRKALYKKLLQFFQESCNYGIQFVMLIAQRRIGDFRRTHIYGECPLEKETFAEIYGRTSAFLILAVGLLLWVFMINGHVTPRNILKKIGYDDPIAYEVEGDSKLADIPFPLGFTYFFQSSWGIWTSFSVAGYRLSSRIHVYTGFLYSDESESQERAEELSRNCKLRVVLAKATGKLVSLCWQVIPLVGIFMSKITLYLNDDLNPLLVRDEKLRDEIGLSGRRKVFQGIKCTLNDCLLIFMMMGVFEGGSLSVTLAFWFCIVKAYLEKFQDVFEFALEHGGDGFTTKSGTPKVHDEDTLKAEIANRASEVAAKKMQEPPARLTNHAEKMVKEQQLQQRQDSKKNDPKDAWNGVLPTLL